MKYFKLPDLGEGLPEAEIVEWHVQEGDQVEVDQTLVSVETAKAIVEVPSPQTGVIAHLFGVAGDTIHTGEPLVEFAGGEDADSGTVVGQLSQARNTDSQRESFIIGAAPSSREAAQQRTTPAVRSLAQRLGVSLDTLRGSGPEGRVTAGDVERAADMDQSFGAPEPLRGVRKQMAKAMAQSHAEVVPVTLCEDADIDHWPEGTDITMRLVQAVAAACAAVPDLNVWFDGQQLARRTHGKIDLGVAVDTEQGLFVPVLRDIGNRSSDDLRDGLNRLRADVKARSIPPAEMQGATITLSNFGTLAGRYASPIIVPPQVAIVGAGVIRRQPVAAGDAVCVHRVMPLSLTFDHRAATGGEAARFMQALIQALSA
ncbi:dihydrolipoamide acetyltransferase family protein [Marinobacterium weihaiense]|uniref:Dihydrolipoamide acetyltransferase component of pyruvate dehydrogenase complex n=1 Tax=Marinobacterium weihaiense TaxID=2851016 RepID=A0ABS6MB46_9GAMM|nr:dihydrolipoamide acetyltransferase family protein [Marinobacterium weihaiense]MBV0933518.1 2-oxo acid dehydrogenase subunit E2 [Marinobacterium weihaiense]